MRIAVSNSLRVHASTTCRTLSVCASVEREGTFWPADCAKMSELLKPDPDVMAFLAKQSLRRPRDGVFKAIADVFNWQLQLARSKVALPEGSGWTFFLQIFGIICLFLGPPSPFSTESCDFPVSHTLPSSKNSKATISFFFNLPNRFCVLFDLLRFTRTLDTTAGVSVFVLSTRPRGRSRRASAAISSRGSASTTKKQSGC
jgi:hypothetical protein